MAKNSSIAFATAALLIAATSTGYAQTPQSQPPSASESLPPSAATTGTTSSSQPGTPGSAGMSVPGGKADGSGTASEPRVNGLAPSPREPKAPVNSLGSSAGGSGNEDSR